MANGATAVDQLGMDEQVIDDADIEAALETRQKRKASLDAVRIDYQEADERAKAVLNKLELLDGRAARVGRFRISRTYIPARTVQPFETAARSQLRIFLVDEA